MKNTLKTITLFFAFFLMTISAYAQGASLFEEGLRLEKSGKWKDAIEKFESSKKIDGTKANVKRCNQHISICRRKIKSSPDNKPAITPRLMLQTSLIHFNAIPASNGQYVNIYGGESIKWSAEVQDDSKNWCSISKTEDGKGLVVSCKESTKTVTRSTNITIISANDLLTLRVSQQGIKPQLAVSEDNKVMSIKKKGGQLIIPIICKSDTIYEDGNNWRVLEMPEWCHQTYKKNPKMDGWQKFTFNVSNLFANTESQVKLQQEKADSNELVMIVDKLEKKDGKKRAGNIVFECQGEIVQITILQE